MTLRPPRRIPGITALPPSGRGMRIGLFGGSFNPVHAGHALVVTETLRRLQLDALWVLVTPGNPLKSHSDLAPLADRVRGAREVLRHPRVAVTGWEAERGFTYTWQTLDFLRKSLADRHFVWIMGADNLASFHLWERWQNIAAAMPMAVYVRPGSTRYAPVSPVAQALSRWRLDEEDAPRLALMQAPAWIYLHGRQSPLSSSALRGRGQQF